MSLSHILPYIITGLTVSVLHAALPTHWLPFVLAARAQNWSYKKTVSILFIAGSGHIITTTAIGAGIVWFSLKMNESLEHLFVLIASISTFVFGLYYFVQYFRGQKHSHCNHHHPHVHDYAASAKDGWAILSLLSLLTFSPCESFLPVYVSAWQTGWSGFLVLSSVLAIGTLLSMLFFTSLAFQGMKQIRLQFLENYEKIIIGTILMILAVIIYFVEHTNHNHP